MKRLFFCLLLTIGMTSVLRAQDVFTALHASAQEQATDSLAPMVRQQIGQFKLDALDYMLLKMREEMPDSSANYLDRQAMAMHEFVTFYLQTIVDNSKEPPAYMVKLQKIFMDASFSNPLFNDSDTDLTLAYFACGECITRFSLDTDWQRAFIAASTALKDFISKQDPQ